MSPKELRKELRALQKTFQKLAATPFAGEMVLKWRTRNDDEASGYSLCSYVNVEMQEKVRGLARRAGAVLLRLRPLSAAPDPELYWYCFVIEIAKENRRENLIECRRGTGTLPEGGTEVVASWTLGRVIECCDLAIDVMFARLNEMGAPTLKGDTTHSADFTSVKWCGVTCQFSKGLQAECVRVLWEAWENGTPSLSEKTIAEKVGSSNDRFRLEHVFKPVDKKTRKRAPHPAWGTMIVSAGKGLFKLAPGHSESPK